MDMVCRNNINYTLPSRCIDPLLDLLLISSFKLIIYLLMSISQVVPIKGCNYCISRHAVSSRLHQKHKEICTINYDKQQSQEVVLYVLK